MKDLKYPRVLIIGQSFNTKSGGGITLTNLFKGWNKESLAVAAENIQNSDFDICNNYYQFGYNENKRRFPFNLIQKKYKSGVFKIKSSSTHNSLQSNKDNHPNLNSIYDQFLHLLGLFHYSRNLKITDQFLDWYNTFQPQVVYTQLASLELINFINQLHIITNTPLTIHIMDDWPKTISKNGIMKRHWEKIIGSKFYNILKKAKVLIAISDAMAEEYSIRYKREFYVFHNPIDTRLWTNTYMPINNIRKIRILYTGRVGVGINHSLKKIADTIQKINQKAVFNIELIIQNRQIIKWIKKYDFIKQTFIEDYSLYPKSLNNADILILPYDFTKESIRFIRFSFPTKASEYMMSGTPILVLAPKETAVSQHALKHQWAKVVNENNNSKITEALLELIEDETARYSYSVNATIYASNYFNSEIVRENFRKVLSISMI